MKKLLLLLTIGVILTGFGYSQPVLTFETHALKPGENNPMLYCEYLEAGTGGINVTWDFSKLSKVKEFTGYVDNNLNVDFQSDANTVLEEFENSFYYDVNLFGIQETGYMSKDQKTKIIYTTPYEKIRYPFSFGDNYSSAFEGMHYYSDKVTGNISGNSLVEADGWGKLILPGAEFENAIRIKNVKEYTLTNTSGGSYEVAITTYRWYNNVHRYPLLVLTEIVSGTTNKTIGYQAAYNPEAVKELEDISIKTPDKKVKLYPNPVTTELNVSIESENSGTAYFSIHDATGKTIYADGELEILQGTNIFKFDTELTNLMPGMYIFNFIKGTERITREFVLVK